MADLADLEGPSRLLGFVLEIDGVETEWDDLDGTHTARTNHAAKGGLVASAPSREDLDDVGGIVNGGEVTVKVTHTRTNLAADTLGRVTPKGAARSARLAVSLGDDPLAGATVEVSDSIAAWPATGTIWVGLEAMRYAARTVVPPYQFTVNPGDRGWFNSPVQSHPVSPTDGSAPDVTDACVNWRGRPARLRVAVVLRAPDGTLVWTDEVDLANGFLDTTPDQTGSQAHELQIVPWHARIDGDIGGERYTTQLQPGWHLFDGETGHRFVLSYFWDRGAALRLSVQGVAGAVVQCAHAYYQGWADDTLPNVEPFLRGRRGAIAFEGAPGAPAPAGAYYPQAGGYAGPGLTGAAGDTLTLDAVPVGLAIGHIMVNATSTEYRAAEMTTPGVVAAVRWPDGALATIRTTLGTQNPNGAAGAWANVLVLADAGDGSPGLSARLNVAYALRPLKLGWVVPHAAADEPSKLWYGLDLFAPDSTYVLPGPDGPRNNGLHPLDRQMMGAAWRTFDVSAPPNDEDEERDTFPIRGIAGAYWQTGEKYLLVADDVFDGSTGTVLIRWTNQVGTPQQTTVRFSDKKLASTIVAGCPGWALIVADEDRWQRPSFGDWGQESATIQSDVRFSGTPANEALLRLLISPEGGATTWGDLPYGCGIPSTNIDTTSFLRFPVPAGRIGQTFLSIKGEVAMRDLISGILTQLGAALTTWLNPTTGQKQLRLIQTGVPSRVDSSLTIDAGDWVLSGMPVGVWDDRIVTSRTYELIGETGLDPNGKVTFVDAAAKRRHNEDAGGSVTLYGVSLPAYDVDTMRAALLPVWQVEVGARSDVRLVVRGVISAQQAVRLNPGDIVTLSCDEVLGYNATAISGETARVLSVERDDESSDAHIEAVVYTVRGTGIAPSLRVNATPAANQVTVNANTYSTTASHIDGSTQTDVGFFAIGDTVNVFTMDGTLTLLGGTITGIAGNTVTLNFAHGLVAPDFGYLTAGAYPASTAQSRYAHWADANGTLGVGNVAADDYA